MKSKILITGAGGYIGSVAAYLFLQKGYEVLAVDNFSTGYRQPLELLKNKFGENKLRIYEIDLQNDLGKLFKNEKDISAVLHYAASCIVDESMNKPEKYFKNNILGTLNLLESMTANNILNFVFSSTAAVYGEAKKIPVEENHPTEPVNVYGESKLIAEKIIQWYGKVKGVKYCILRYFNVCAASDDGLIGDSKKPSSLLVQNSVRGALGIAPFYLTCPEVDTPDQTPIRDYVNVVDLNEAHFVALDYLMKGGKSEIINLGTGTGNSVLEIVNQVQEITGKKFEIKKTTPGKGDPARIVASIEKAKKVLGWKPRRLIADSVKSLVKWYGPHPQGWEK
ncbi:UDP-glucose 4-epimerase GalE [Candidatus Roizmanbacteria bacterium RIFCSPHIGHO2_02_FULL_37_9b]|nr:MAG: UDP-glucose 4-epimerase GalE [Candidatus Roizmanbacteria bacterium RIFCSPHIGHO2_02_FULL_37_9b]